MLIVWQGKAVLTKVTKVWRILAPPGAPFFSFSSLVSLLLRGCAYYLNSFLSVSLLSWVSRMSGGFVGSVLSI